MFTRATFAFAVVLSLQGCAVDQGEIGSVDTVDDLDQDEQYPLIDEEDPAAAMDGVEMWDEGPPDDDEWADDDGAIELALPPRFQLPFPCGQVWAGQTRTDHNPQNSVDFNRFDDFGDAVVASAAGTVRVVQNLGSTSYGRWIEISHGNGYATRYAHLSSQGVSVGQHVDRGQRIGRVGSTGGSTGPHLHYEQRVNGVVLRARFDGAGAAYFGTRNYKSANCGGGGGDGGATGRVNTSGPSLLVRSGPHRTSSIVGSAADGATVTIRCQKHGDRISGTYGTTDLWDRVGGGFVSDAYVYTGSDGRVAPDCD
jgi:hypothetical protein